MKFAGYFSKISAKKPLSLSKKIAKAAFILVYFFVFILR